MKFLSGVYTHGLDSKNRIRIPAKLRAEITESGEGLHFVQYTSDCITVMTDSQLREKFGSFDDIDPTDDNAWDAVRFILGKIEDVKEDEQGRIVLSKGMRDFIGVDKEHPELVTVGVINHIEIWSAERYNKRTGDMSFARAQEITKACRQKLSKVER